MEKLRWTLISIAALMAIGTQAALADVTQGLVAHYPFSGDAMDATGNGNDCTVIGADPTTDRNGNLSAAYNFDGVGDYLDCTAGPSLDITDTITIAAWIKPEADVADWAVVTARWSGFDTQEVFGLYTTSVDEVAGEIATLGGNLYRTSDQNLVAIHEWQHVAMVYSTETNTFALYRNGVKLWEWGDLFYGGTPQIVTTDNNLTIGVVKRNEFLYHFFAGSIDDVRIYNRALSESEIVDVAGADSSSCGEPSTVSATLDIHLPSLLYLSPFGTIDIWADMVYYGQGPNGELLWQLKEFGEN